MATMITLAKKYQALLSQAQQRQHPDTDALRLCFQLLSTAGAIDQGCAQRLAPYALSEGRFVMLFLLEAAPAGLSPNALATQAGITRATVTGLLDGLEKEGYIVRTPAATDRRSLTIVLTDQGRQLSAQVFAEHTQWMSGLFNALSPEERQHMMFLLQKMATPL
ncbi:MAG: MarR family transcriptional regulator [Neisseriaceae bacterium]|nr:MarR family transcriptional regulator [Neisseriaceae bacterium]